MGGNCITELEQKKLDVTLREEARQHYLKILDDILTPLLHVENTLLNDELNQFLLIDDYYALVREALAVSRPVRLTKFKPSACDVRQ